MRNSFSYSYLLHFASFPQRQTVCNAYNCLSAGFHYGAKDLRTVRWSVPETWPVLLETKSPSGSSVSAGSLSTRNSHCHPNYRGHAAWRCQRGQGSPVVHVLASPRRALGGNEKQSLPRRGRETPWVEEFKEFNALTSEFGASLSCLWALFSPLGNMFRRERNRRSDIQTPESHRTH